jgi:peptide/nickel transport system permease protein
VAIATPTRTSARQSRLHGVSATLQQLIHRPAGLIGLIIVVGLIILAVVPGIFAPYEPDAQTISDRLPGPSMDHLLGTDRLGRDTLSRLIYGVGIALIVALPAVLSALVIGLLLGIVAAWRGGLIDAVLVIVMDVLQAFPAVILALALLALLGPSLRNVIIVISIAFIPNYARVSRALVFSAKANQWVEAERALGASTLRIVFTHILPNILPPLLILMAMDIPSAIVIEAGLSFLGLGVQPPTPSWGAILSDGFQNIMQSPWGVVFASIILMITTLGFTMLGETLRDIVDPRLSGLTRRRW